MTHAGHSLLLTGDLEKQGTARVIGLPPPSVDVLMAPHHGSRAAFTSPFVAWAKPTFVVVNRGFRASGAIGPNDAGPNATVWDTVTFGAVTIRSHRTGLTAEAFRTNDRMVLRRGGK